MNCPKCGHTLVDETPGQESCKMNQPEGHCYCECWTQVGTCEQHGLVDEVFLYRGVKSCGVKRRVYYSGPGDGFDVPCGLPV